MAFARSDRSVQSKPWLVVFAQIVLFAELLVWNNLEDMMGHSQIASTMVFQNPGTLDRHCEDDPEVFPGIEKGAASIHDH